MPKRKRDHPIAWTWRLEDGSLCLWADVTKEDLVKGGMPSPDAKPVCVRLVPNVEYRELIGGK